MQVIRLLALLVLLFTGLFAQESTQNNEEAQAAEVEEDEEVEVDSVVSSPDVAYSCVFPRYPNDALPLGKPLEVLFGFQNLGQHTFGVIKIRGSLRYAPDPSFILQNFTAFPQGKAVGPASTVSFSYWFYPDPLLEPKDYVITVNADYFDEANTNFTTVVCNKKVDLIEAESDLDMQTVFSYLIGASLLGLVFYVVYNVTNKSTGATTKKADKKTTSAAVPKVSAGSADWTSNAQMDQFFKSKAKKA